jgi:hypothetical protein
MVSALIIARSARLAATIDAIVCIGCPTNPIVAKALSDRLHDKCGFRW